jgi:hypothetical protein
MLKIVFKYLQRLIETEKAGMRKLRNVQKLKMQMREVALTLIPTRIPISLSNYRDLMWKVMYYWYVSYTYFYSK